MKLFLLLLGCLLGAGTLTPAAAQQVLCQRAYTMPGASGLPTTRLIGNITAVNADSALTLVATSPSGFANGQFQRSALVWVKRGQCDTTSFQTVGKSTNYTYGLVPVQALTTRRKYLRVLTTNFTSSSVNTLQLWEFARNGQLRGQNSYSFGLGVLARGLLEAPDQGTYLCVGNYPGAGDRTTLVKVSDQRQVQWQRTYSSRGTGPGSTNFEFSRPCYTVRGNLLLAGSVINIKAGGAAEQYGQVVEVNQQGDSLTSRPILRGRLNTAAMLEEVRPLRDGGFLLRTNLDTTTTTTCAFTRLDANLNEVWTRFYSPSGKRVFGYNSGGNIGDGLLWELADGTLLAAVNLLSSANNTNLGTRLLRLAATGQFMQEYTVPGTAFTTQSMAPVAADSSFILSDRYGVSTLLQLRLPGLRRTAPAQTIPAAQPLATRPTAGPATAGPAWPAPAYPNPAATSVTVPLPALAGEARLTLTDILGRQVRAQTVTPGISAATVAVGGRAPGVYVLTLERAGQPPAVQRITVSP